MSGYDQQSGEATGDLVDWEVANKFTAGDDTLLSELIEMFEIESSKHLAEIQAGIEANDSQRLSRGAHSLKSAAGLFGSVKLAASALQVEQLGADFDTAATALQLEDLRTLTAQLVSVLACGRPAPSN